MSSYGKHVTISYLALIVIVIATPMGSNAQSPEQGGNDTYIDLGDVSVYLGMHTINFTSILGIDINQYRGSGSLNSSLPEILEAIRNITTSCNTLSCLAQNRTARISIEQSLRELERSGYIDPGAVDEILRSIDQAYVGDNALKSLINDPEISQLINNISISGAENYPNALGILDSLFRGGRISLNQYIAALELLKRSLLRQGLESQAIAIDKMQLEALKQLVLSNTAQNLVKSLTSILASTEGSGSTELQGGGGDRTPYLEAMPPNIYMPTPSPMLGFDLLKLLLIVISISALVALAVLGIPSQILRILRKGELGRSSRLDRAGRGSGVIDLYWRAVSIMSRRIPRRDYETHREYLEKVKRHMGMIDPFEDLTGIYERVRYAHEPEDRYVERALKDYKELERS